MMAGSRLLVVEDHAATRCAMRVLFSRRGWQVVEAATVTEALALLAPPPDYLILDLVLPDGDGEAVLRKVREDDLATRVSVVTGLLDPIRLGRVEVLQPCTLFAKPVDVALLWKEGEAARVGRCEPHSRSAVVDEYWRA